jgi:hypothetical protein
LIETLQINEFPASSRDVLVTNNYLTRANEADNNGVEPGSSSLRKAFSKSGYGAPMQDETIPRARVRGRARGSKRAANV